MKKGTLKFELANFTGFSTKSRDAGGGGPGGHVPPKKFGILVNPIWTKGGRLCPPYYYWPPHLFGRCNASGKYINIRKAV